VAGEARLNCGSEAKACSTRRDESEEVAFELPGANKYSAEGGTRTLTPEGTGT
jgi:hypothetical protein